MVGMVCVVPVNQVLTLIKPNHFLLSSLIQISKIVVPKAVSVSSSNFLVFKGFPREYYPNSKLMQKHGGELAGCGSVIRELRVVSQVSLLESRHPRSELYHESIF